MSQFIPLERLRRAFRHPDIRRNQDAAFRAIADSGEGVLIEMPTGDGKTDVGMAALNALPRVRQGLRVYITPTRALVDQLQREFPGGVVTVFGRGEYRCLYYEARGINDVNAQESPCYMLSCGHRVNQETGETEDSAAEPCPYFQAKYMAMQQATEGGVVICTTAFFLMNRTLVPRWREVETALVVVDEAHRIAQIARRVFEQTVTDFHLLRAARLLKDVSRDQANVLVRFVRTLRRLARRHPARQQNLFSEDEVTVLVRILGEIRRTELQQAIREAVRSGRIDPDTQRGDLKVLQDLSRTLPRILESLRYAVGTDERRPLKYVVAFYFRQDDPEVTAGRKRARYHLTIKSYFVAPLITRALGPTVVAYSATIGGSEVFGWETGIRHPFHTFDSEFPVEQTRIFLPKDVRDLSFGERRHRDVNWTLRQTVEMARRFARAGHRSLVVVVSEAEREQFLRFAGEKQLEALSYGFGADARQVAEDFRSGRGQALVGTAAQYGEGVDLPSQMAPVIFFLRPGYPHPGDPEAQFEEDRFPASQVWALRRWRVLIQALQVRGRNIRSAEDLGVCFFMSRQFGKFLFAGLPKWLQPAYRDKLDMEGAVKDTLALLRTK